MTTDTIVMLAAAVLSVIALIGVIHLHEKLRQAREYTRMVDGCTRTSLDALWRHYTALLMSCPGACLPGWTAEKTAAVIERLRSHAKDTEEAFPIPPDVAMHLHRAAVQERQSP